MVRRGLVGHGSYWIFKTSILYSTARDGEEWSGEARVGMVRVGTAWTSSQNFKTGIHIHMVRRASGAVRVGRAMRGKDHYIIVILQYDTIKKQGLER